MDIRPYLDAGEALIRQEDEQGLVLLAGGKQILSLQLLYKLTRDRTDEHLRVVESQLRVMPVPGRRPVFRYEYDREKESGTQPAAHIQVHGNHPELQELMLGAGRGTTRSSERSGVPDITDLHFPVGGTRFRPCVEDLVEFLIHEFRIEPSIERNSALQKLAEGRARWREKQLRSAVRDAPWVAREVLASLEEPACEPRVPPEWFRL
ncbi:hypothetical protein [Mariniluteicoccus endophyticus]